MDWQLRKKAYNDNSAVYQLLPEGYDYEFVKTEYFVTDQTPSDLSTVVRCNIFTKEQVLSWIKQFQEKNHVTLRVHQSYEENTPIISFKRVYRCMNNTRPKKGSTPIAKHTGCRAKLIATLKNRKIKRSKDTYLKTHPCEIYIRHTHNHPFYSSSVLQCRPPSQELEDKFKSLFENGHSPLSALTLSFPLMPYGQIKLGKKGLNTFKDYESIIADGQKYPSEKWVHDLYHSIFKKKFGEPTEAEIASLEESIRDYNEECNNTCAAICMDKDNFLSVGICSPTMKRIHENIESSRELMFVYSLSNLDRHTTTLLFLCPTSAGVLPLAILFLNSESEKSITKGINALKTILPQKAFYKRGFPRVIISGDNDAEKNALQKCFSCSKLLLSNFHVSQSTMRYLWDYRSSLNVADRIYVYNIFNEALNCLKTEEFLIQFDKLLQTPCVLRNKKVHQYFQNLKASAAIWAMCYRQEKYRSGNKTNYYCEAMFRTLNDEFLPKTRNFDIVELFDYTISSFEHNYFSKIMEHSTRQSKEEIERKNMYFNNEKNPIDLECEKLSCNVYKVQSKRKEYVVNYELKLCSCYLSKIGEPCRHHFAVFQKYNLPFHQFCPTIADDSLKSLLNKVITGEECSASANCDGFQKSKGQHIVPQDESNFTEWYEEVKHSKQIEIVEIKESHSAINNDPAGTKIRKQVNEVFNQIMSKYKSNQKKYKKPIEAFINQFNSCKTDSSLIYALQAFGTNKGAAISRAKEGLDAPRVSTRPLRPIAPAAPKVFAEIPVVKEEEIPSGVQPTLLSLRIIAPANQNICLPMPDDNEIQNTQRQDAMFLVVPDESVDNKGLKDIQRGKTIDTRPSTTRALRKSALVGNEDLQSSRSPKRQKLLDHCYFTSVRDDNEKSADYFYATTKKASPFQYRVDSDTVIYL